VSCKGYSYQGLPQLERQRRGLVPNWEDRNRGPTSGQPQFDTNMWKEFDQERTNAGEIGHKLIVFCGNCNAKLPKYLSRKLARLLERAYRASKVQRNRYRGGWLVSHPCGRRAKRPRLRYFFPL
jgi:hypothetical protein